MLVPVVMIVGEEQPEMASLVVAFPVIVGQLLVGDVLGFPPSQTSH